MKFRLLQLLSLLLIVSAMTFAQQKKPSECPLHEQHMREQKAKSARLTEVNRRGEKAMGFSQTKTTHHFLLQPEGGMIQVETNHPKDTKNRRQIRVHLAEVAQSFSAGDFKKPLQTHGEMPAGVATMQRLKSDISFKYESTPKGGRVRIATNNAEALAAIHEFLRYQITDHQTGDPLEVKGQ